MGTITNILESLTKLETFLLMVMVGQAIIIGFMIGTVEKLKATINDFKVMNNRFYTMYMQLSTQSLDIVLKWQRCIEENKELILKSKA